MAQLLRIAGARVIRDPVFVAQISHIDRFTFKPDRLILSLLASSRIRADNMWVCERLLRILDLTKDWRCFDNNTAQNILSL